MIRIGLSGWVYQDWRGGFYPEGMAARRWLPHVASQFDTVEVNAAFYRLQKPGTFARWRSETPSGFLFAVKGSRYITHMLKLGGGDAPLGNFFAQGVLALGSALGPILWQLPPMLGFQRDRAERFFDSLPRDVAQAERVARRHDARVKSHMLLTAPDGRTNPIRYALEVRHPSWLDDAALALVERHGLALVVADTAGRFPEVEHLTSPDLVYARLHGSQELYRSGYDARELATWVRRITRWSRLGRDVFVYFDNTDGEGHAPYDALRLRSLLDTIRGRLIDRDAGDREERPGGGSDDTARARERLTSAR